MVLKSLQRTSFTYSLIILTLVQSDSYFLRISFLFICGDYFTIRQIFGSVTSVTVPLTSSNFVILVLIKLVG